METIDLQRRAPLFSNRDLVALIIPLVIERFLEMAVGIADTLMVSSAGETAVSAVSLVDNISNLVINIIAALATGGAVIISQYLGREETKRARTAAKQLVYTATGVTLLLTAVSLIARRPLLALLFGSLESAVMEQALTYFWITAVSFPFIAIFNSCAALFRSMGNSKFSMIVSLIMNVINIGGNAILIYGLSWGVAGAAAASLVSRMVAAVLMLLLLRDHRNILYLSHILRVRLKPDMIKNILRIGIPSGMENGVFYIGKILVQSLVSTFGTAAIAANAVAGRVHNFALVPGMAISLAIITVIGQCVGAGEYRQVQHYTKKLMGWIYLTMLGCCAITYALAAPATHIFNLSAEATAMSIELLRVSAVITLLIWPVAFPFANVLRAAGDVKYTMVVSMVSMVLVRIGLSYALAYVWGLGLMSVWLAMFADWIVRAVLFSIRYAGGKWKNIKVI